MGDLGLIPGLGWSSGERKGYPFWNFGLGNSTDCKIHGVAKSWTWLINYHFHFSTMSRAWQNPDLSSPSPPLTPWWSSPPPHVCSGVPGITLPHSFEASLHLVIHLSLHTFPQHELLHCTITISVFSDPHGFLWRPEWTLLLPESSQKMALWDLRGCLTNIQRIIYYTWMFSPHNLLQTTDFCWWKGNKGNWCGRPLLTSRLKLGAGLPWRSSG